MAEQTKKLEAPKDAPETEKDELAGSEAPLLDHLIELRKRLIRSLLVIFGLLIVLFFFAKTIYEVLLEPYRAAVFPEPVEVIFTSPPEWFFTQLNVAFFASILFGFPYLATEIYGFVAPGLYKKERGAFIPYLIATPLLFLLGTGLVYFVVLPMALHFFLSTQTEEIHLLMKASEYLGFAMTLILAFGICFQLPVILTLLAQIDLISSKTLKGGRKYAIVAILVFAAFITPPDPISQIGLSVPLYLLYEISIWSVMMVERRRAKALAAEAVKAQDVEQAE
ncbi:MULTISPECIES: twin-arginine translocase subunit TatC [unclassified Devosia]|jgi:sec-independent protein translocase protein TatC|uniref:twin-arginine translocase subunit TatC n=1 Tax=unclassified Devosia TaxID=196773 RepID=UPI00086ADF92|nr:MULTISPECIES: twin-arginine translocase subunit TatC [unclassified Devosia]MBN9361194.1 twin-arginine translocase subunit TatC [Devosia sp.]ODS94534.1 MAG: twin arginine-targeting protein translocase TatC [Devosia sp. SCN 66-27]OJX26293.1 MAG: twin arginine-targeting protein translocase TatC [Devosia sp. 66-14]